MTFGEFRGFYSDVSFLGLGWCAAVFSVVQKSARLIPFFLPSCFPDFLLFPMFTPSKRRGDKNLLT